MWRVSLLWQGCSGHSSTRRFVFSCKEEKLPYLEESKFGCPQRATGCRGSAVCSCVCWCPLSPAQEQGKHVPLTLVAKEAVGYNPLCLGKGKQPSKNSNVGAECFCPANVMGSLQTGNRPGGGLGLRLLVLLHVLQLRSIWHCLVSF